MTWVERALGPRGGARAIGGDARVMAVLAMQWVPQLGERQIYGGAGSRVGAMAKLGAMARGYQALGGALARGYLALHIPQHQFLVLDLQDEILPPDPSLSFQHLQARQAVIGAADVPLQAHREQVLGRTRHRVSPGVLSSPHTLQIRGTLARLGGLGRFWVSPTSTWCWKSLWGLSRIWP